MKKKTFLQKLTKKIINKEKIVIIEGESEHFDYKEKKFIVPRNYTTNKSLLYAKLGHEVYGHSVQISAQKLKSFK